MPSFYPRPLPRQLPLTPPEFVSQYSSQGCGGHSQYQPAHFQAQAPSHRMGRQDESRYDYAQRYGQTQATAPPTVVTYQQPPSYMDASTMPPTARYYEPIGAPILPPMRAYDPAAFAAQEQRQRREQQVVKEEKPVGGVSATLDYDMETMTDFVTEMTQGLLSNGRPADPAFRKWVHSVLCATRLPSATIVLSLHYLATHLRIKSSTTGSVQGADEDIHKALTVALILGSKFLDDNTFINRSWAEVSFIPVHVLNYLEFQWLNEIDFQLHQIAKDLQGWPKWQQHWENFQKRSPRTALAKSTQSLKLSPLDTSVQRHASMQNMFSPVSAVPPQRYSRSSVHGALAAPPAYSQYDPWNHPRSAVDTSPHSAPHTGPPTPEYYGGSSVWAQTEGYSRRTMFGFQQQPQVQPHYSVPPPAYTHTPVTPQFDWGVHHGMHCSCLYCSRHTAFPMPASYGPQAVVA